MNSESVKPLLSAEEVLKKHVGGSIRFSLREMIVSAMEEYASQLQPSSPQSNLVEALEEYIGVLGDEINDLIGMASIHGWQSRNVERGKELRDKISNLKSSQPSSPQLEQEVKRLQEENERLKFADMTHEIEKQFFETIANQEMNLDACSDRIKELERQLAESNAMLCALLYPPTLQEGQKDPEQQ